MDSQQLYDVLLTHQDEAYRQMQQKLIPNINPETIIGVRTPVLRALAKQPEDRDSFFQALPHRFFEENQIHCFLLEGEKDFPTAIRRTEAFLPYVDNWATCDQLRPKCFRRNREALLPYIRQWIASDKPYTVRFGLEMLMVHYLDEDFDPVYLDLASSVRSDEYYVRMMVAWFFATALAKQYDAALPLITEHRLEPWVHNKTIQKAVESYRVLPEHKRVLIQCRTKQTMKP